MCTEIILLLKVMLIFIFMLLLLIFRLLLFKVFIFLALPNDPCTPYQTTVFIKLRFNFCSLFHNVWISSKLISLYCLPTIHLMDKQECSKFIRCEELLRYRWAILFGFIECLSILKIKFREIKLKIKFYFFLHEF